jgi:hypothetical protein
MCDIGYVLKRLHYSTLISCACDRSRIAYDFWYSNVSLNSCGCEVIKERILRLESHSDIDPLLNKCGNIVSIKDFLAIQCETTVSPIQITAGTRLANDRNVFSISGLKIDKDKSNKIDYLIQYSGDTQLYLEKITIPTGDIPLFDNKRDGAPFNAYACSNIFLEGKRYVTVNILDKVVKRHVGDNVYAFVNDTFIECFWNGTKWVDTKGFSIGIHKGKSSSRPNSRIKGSSSQYILESNDIGYEYYDTTISKLIYVKSIDSKGMVVWVDAMGNVIQ